MRDNLDGSELDPVADFVVSFGNVPVGMPLTLSGWACNRW